MNAVHLQRRIILLGIAGVMLGALAPEVFAGLIETIDRVKPSTVVV